MGGWSNVYNKATSRQKWRAGIFCALVWVAAGIKAGPGNFWEFMIFSVFFLIAAVFLIFAGSHGSDAS
jgi:hypothetical protein